MGSFSVSPLFDIPMKSTIDTICVDHIRDEWLTETLRTQVAYTYCGLCERDEPDKPDFAVAFDELVAEVRGAMGVFYTDAESVLFRDSESESGYAGRTYEVREVLDDVAAELVDDDFEQAFMEALIEGVGWDVTWTDVDLIDLETGIGLTSAWESFKDLVTHEARFVFLQRDEEYVIDGELTASGLLQQLGRAVEGPLRTTSLLPAGTSVYRGRLFETIDIERHGNASALGPAPKKKAAANRMSPRGVAMLYASADPQTAIAEIAGHSVKPLALIGGFTSTRDLTVFDLSKPVPIPSPYDKVRRDEYHRALFLRHFVADITRPIILDGREHLEYVPTQIVTEYLRWLLHEKLDGIALPSSRQEGATTYVFFFDDTDVRDSKDEDSGDAAFTLAHDDITAYEVERRYVGKSIPSALPDTR